MCIDDQMLSAYLDGELKEPYFSEVKEHLLYCQACRARLDDFKSLSDDIRSLETDKESLSRNKEKIFSLLDEKYFKRSRKTSVFRRKFEFSLPGLVTAAAAVVFIYAGSFILFNADSSGANQILPSFQAHADSSNVQFVSQRTNSLEQYSIDHIIRYLEEKGYEVDIAP